MKEEYIDIVTKTGEATGKSALKSEIHSKGYYHNTAHVWLYTKEGDILLAQRAASKAICPLLWDVSAAGHVDAGEDIKHAAIRETHEEIGLLISEHFFEKIGVFESFQSYKNGIVDNEFHHTYIAKIVAEAFSYLVPQQDEVEALKLVSINVFQDLLDNSETNGHFVASNMDYYNKVIKAILDRIT